MSRSRRKTPIVAFSTSESEKADKQAFHRQARHAVRQTLGETLGVEGAKAKHRRSGRWDFAKDGKRWVESCSDRRNGDASPLP